MLSLMRKARPRRSTPLLLALCMTLSACVTPINTSLIAPPCRPLVEASGLLSPTRGAARPQSETAGELAGFGDRQTGQLDKANADKAGADRILAACEARNAAAIAAAKPKPFWKFWR